MPTIRQRDLLASSLGCARITKIVAQMKNRRKIVSEKAVSEATRQINILKNKLTFKNIRPNRSGTWILLYVVSQPILPIVLPPHTRVKPLAVVIVAGNALVAHPTMLRALHAKGTSYLYLSIQKRKIKNFYNFLCKKYLFSAISNDVFWKIKNLCFG